MNKTQTNRVTMFKTTAAVLHENQSIWSATPPLVAAVQESDDVIAAIDQSAQTQETPMAGVAVDKHSARDALEDVLFLTCEAFGAYATKIKDNDLVALTDLTPTSLHRLGDEQLANRATTILERANTKKTELAAYHVTQANLDELTQALEDFKSSKHRPREAVGVRTAETQSLASLIRQENDILRNTIDRMVNVFRRSHPKFVAAYRSARVIVDRPATHESSKPPTPPTPNP